MHVCVCVCVSERERERARERACEDCVKGKEEEEVRWVEFFFRAWTWTQSTAMVVMVCRCVMG